MEPRVLEISKSENLVFKFSPENEFASDRFPDETKFENGSKLHRFRRFLRSEKFRLCRSEVFPRGEGRCRRDRPMRVPGLFRSDDRDVGISSEWFFPNCSVRLFRDPPRSALSRSAPVRFRRFDCLRPLLFQREKSGWTRSASFRQKPPEQR